MILQVLQNVSLFLKTRKRLIEVLSLDFISEEAPSSRKSGYSFGLRLGFNSNRSQTPGPKYKPEGVGSFQPKPGYSFGHRPRFGRRISDTPGPGEYENFLFKGTPAYSFGVKNHTRGRINLHRHTTPAPLDYRPELSIKKGAPAYSFGTKSRTRLFAPKDYDLPGPGEFVEHETFKIQFR